MNPTIKTVEGHYFNFLEPEKSMITVAAIAHALSNICRFTGHCRQFYSVAQHSVIASHIVPKEYAFEALMHDAAEAYIGDVSSPLKMLLPDYKVIERRVELAIAARFALPLVMSSAVKRADLIMLASERRDLMLPDNNGEWGILDGVEPLVLPIHPEPPAVAYHRFRTRFAELDRARAAA